MTFSEEVHKMTEYTKAVRKAWVKKEIYLKKEHHDPKDDVSKNLHDDFHPAAHILVDRWIELIDHSEIPSSPQKLHEKICIVEEFLRMLQ